MSLAYVIRIINFQHISQFDGSFSSFILFYAHCAGISVKEIPVVTPVYGTDSCLVLNIRRELVGNQKTCIFLTQNVRIA